MTTPPCLSTLSSLSVSFSPHIGADTQVVSAHTLMGPGEIKMREVVLDPEVSPEEIMSREVELGCESWTFFASSSYSIAVQRTLSL